MKDLCGEPLPPPDWVTATALVCSEYEVSLPDCCVSGEATSCGKWDEPAQGWEEPTDEWPATLGWAEWTWISKESLSHNTRSLEGVRQTNFLQNKKKKITRYYLKENLRQGKTQKKRKVHCTRQSTSWSEGSGSRHYSHRFRGPLFNVISRVKIGSRFNCILGSDFKSYIPSLMPGFFLLSGMYLKEEFQGWQDGKVGNPACQQAWRNQVRVPVSTQKKERTNSCNWSSPCRPPTHTHTSNKYKFKNKNKSFHCLISLQS